MTTQHNITKRNLNQCRVILASSKDAEKNIITLQYLICPNSIPKLLSSTQQ